MPFRLAKLLRRPDAADLPLATLQPKHPGKRLLVSLLVAMALPAIGVAVASLQARWQLQQRADKVVAQSIGLLDQMLGNADTSNNAVMQLAGGPCNDDTRQLLQRQVATVPFVRSVNLVEHDRLYCTSLLGSTDQAIGLEAYVDGRLRLRPGNATTPEVPILVVRQARDQRGALSVIDGRYLHRALQFASDYSELYLVVGPLYMDKFGQVHKAPVPPLPQARSSIASAHFPYTVVAGSPEGSIVRYLMDYDLALLVLIGSLGLLSGVICYRLLGRPASPRTQLQGALNAKQFEPFVQPIVNATDGRWSGVEVLMRWRLPGEGLIRPDLFIPMAEQTGLILPMTRDLMRQVAEALVPHATELPPHFHVGFNISAAHCNDPRLLDDCRDFLARFPPGSIELWLELTERQLIEPTEQTDLLFMQLDSIGVKVAIDDFGIGHASLNYLQRFKVDALKIDQSFIKRIGADTLSAHLLDTLVELATKLEIDLIAEGVETAAQRDYLRALHVRYLQGYFFGRPMPIGEFIHAHRHKRDTADHP
ncbi:EAL domain-containing protein [Jeongeupia naejangsanensis]|uniref:cyclic-guanylate-specific phosphodiesterase n=1 Tax=Jeongeupia naejangsanensis TaxID=613195 RepID=A0ABS2BRQ2_9NEIS|nr:EAL domain-containing protein [Jeongeupia naejangsanensis]MBM3117484.1 EAL domain-containing protein [Jeongeupia naejangsanensis]